MTNVYKNAAVTIFASAAADVNAGILKPYTPASSVALMTLVRLKVDPEDEGEVYLSRRVPQEEQFADCFVNMPLADRGWALQEQILSRRSLYYGERAIYWTCRTCQEAADGAALGEFLMSVLPDTIPPAFTVSDESAYDSQEIFYQWLGVVGSYQLRHLTRKSDKLPAISGLAREVHRLTRGTFLAVIWREDFFNGLLWSLVTPEHVPNHTYRGPSWSWVGLDGETRFLTRDTVRTPSSHDCQIIQIEVCPKTQDSFGAVELGIAMLKGLTLHLEQSLAQFHESEWKETAGSTYHLWREKDCHPDFAFLDESTSYYKTRPSFKDIPPLAVPKNRSNDILTVSCLVLYLGIWTSNTDKALAYIDLEDIEESQELYDWHQAYALVLQPVRSAPTDDQVIDERIGVLVMDVFKSSYFRGRSWQMREVTIV
jgi:hypothetical protein